MSVNVAPSAQASPASAPVILILSPLAGVASGSVTVDVLVDQTDQKDPVTDVNFGIFSGGYQSQDILVAPGECAPRCRVHATFDTKSLVVPTSVTEADKNLFDGPALVEATVYTTLGQESTTGLSLTLDNHRPVLSLPDLPIDPLTGSRPAWAGNQDLQTTVSTTPNSGSHSALTSMMLWVPGAAAGSLLYQPAAIPAQGAGTVDFYVGGASAGDWVGYLAAFDENGAMSALTEVNVTIGHWTLTALTNLAYSDRLRIELRPTWADGTSDTAIDGVLATVDGTSVNVDAPSAPDHAHALIDLYSQSGGGFSVGVHTLSLRVWDNRGIEVDLTQPIWISDPVTALFSVSLTRPGFYGTISISARSWSDSVKQIGLAVDGAPVTITHSGSQVPFDAVAIFPAGLTAGTHDLTATVTLNDGAGYVFHQSVTLVEPAAVVHPARLSIGLKAPTKRTWGDPKALFSAHATTDGVGRAGVVVNLQSRPFGSQIWVDRAKGTTNGAGDANFSVDLNAVGSAGWRVVSEATTATVHGQSDISVTPVYAKLGRTPAAAAAKSGHRVHFTVYTAPYEPGARVAIGYVLGTRFVVLGYVPVTKKGAAQIYLTLRHPGVYRLQAVRMGTTRIASTPTATWILRVNR